MSMIIPWFIMSFILMYFIRAEGKNTSLPEKLKVCKKYKIIGIVGAVFSIIIFYVLILYFKQGRDNFGFSSMWASGMLILHVHFITLGIKGELK